MVRFPAGNSRRSSWKPFRRRHAATATAKRTQPLQGVERLEARNLMAAEILPLATGQDVFASARLPQDQPASEIVIGFRHGVSSEQIHGLSQAHGLTNLQSLYMGQEARSVQTATLPNQAVDAVLGALRDNPLVEYAEPNHSVADLRVANDPFYGFQWHLQNPTSGSINVAAAWDVTNGSGVTVAVLDTGVAYENRSDGTGTYYVAPDLAGTRFVAGYDFINNDPYANDDHSHGTHVAGTIAQSTNNSTGTAGVAYGASLMPVKVLGRDGSGTHTSIAQGIRWAADKGAQIINLSLGSSVGSKTLHDAVAYAYGKGATLIAAAGNDGANAVSFPAAYDNYVIAVSATRFDEALAGYSNYGSSIDVAAPGGDVRVDQNRDGYVDGVLQNTFNPSTKNTADFGYYFLQGTSMAAPHVSGVAALVASQLLKQSGVADPAVVRSILQSTARDKGAAGVDSYYGHGIIDAAAAVQAAMRLSNSAPLAQADTASTLQDQAVVIDVLANDSDPDGHALSVTDLSTAANGTVVRNNDGTVTYTPQVGFSGIDSFSYTVADPLGAASTATVSVTVEASQIDHGPAAIDFRNYSIGSYAGSQDKGKASVVDEGATLHVTGNAWKQITMPYQVTADTILEFDFRSPAQGEVHAIGFDRDLSLSPEKGLMLYGTQTWGVTDFRDYAASAPQWKHYRIPVGQFYTGSFKYLFFGNDHDVSRPSAEGYFANVKIYQSTSVDTLSTANNDSFTVRDHSKAGLSREGGATRAGLFFSQYDAVQFIAPAVLAEQSAVLARPIGDSEIPLLQRPTAAVAPLPEQALGQRGRHAAQAQRSVTIVPALSSAPESAAQRQWDQLLLEISAESHPVEAELRF